MKHTYPRRRVAVLELKLSIALVVYLRLMIVSIRLTSKVLDVVGGDVETGSGTALSPAKLVVGGGSGLPPVGISPAKIEGDSAHISASAIASLFMGVAPFEILRKCQCVYIKKNGTRRQDFLQGGLERTNISLAFAQLLRQSKV